MPVVAIGVATVLSGLVARVRMDREGQLRAVTRVVEVAQRALLGGVPPVLRSLRLAVLNASASAEASIEGLLRGAGDPTGSAALGRDVRGKGLDAVRLAEVVLGSFRDAAQNRPGLAQVTAALDRSVTRAIGPEGFVTRCWSRSWATAAPSWSTAGIRRRCWAAAARSPSWTHPNRRRRWGLGPRPEQLRLRLALGDRILLYTDGASEARARSGFFPLQSSVTPARCMGCSRSCLVCCSGCIWARGSPCAPQNSTSWPPDSSGREACCNRRSPTPTNPPQSTSPNQQRHRP